MKRLWCWIACHQYEVWQVFSATSRRVICRRCGGDWGMNDDVRAMIDWSPELEAMYTMFGRKIRPRQP